MDKIELYDIITLDNNLEYTVIKRQELNKEQYLLLAPVDEEETPDFDKLKIVKEIIDNKETIVEDVEDEELLKQLSAKFLSSLKEDIN